MTTQQLIPNDGILAATDIAKARSEVLVDVPGGRRRRRLIILNQRTDHDRLAALLTGLGQPIVCRFEATGNYHRPQT